MRVFVGLSAVLLSGCSSARLAPDAPEVAAAPAAHRVLFVGNSYTYGNDLPGMYRSFAAGLEAPPEPLHVDSVTSGGWRLAQHADEWPRPSASRQGSVGASPAGRRLHRLLSSSEVPPWTHVVLQEQSQIPGFGPGHEDYDASLGAAATLARKTAARDAKVVLFVTWGRRAGDRYNPERFPDFSTMQARLTEGYRALADAARAEGAEVRLAPVGPAFAVVAKAEGTDASRPSSLFYRLYADDGSHPSVLGTYLAVCVFARVLLGSDPNQSGFVPEGLSVKDAARLRAAAAKVIVAP